MLFTAALQLVDPWHVTDVEFRDTDAGERELHITIRYGPGSRFHCPEASCPEEARPDQDMREGVHPRLRAARGVPGARREDCDGAVGASGQRVHAGLATMY